MASARLKVHVTRRLPAPIESRLTELFDTSFNSQDRAMSRAELEDVVASVDVLVPTITDLIDANLLAQAVDGDFADIKIIKR